MMGLDHDSQSSNVVLKWPYFGTCFMFCYQECIAKAIY